MYENEWHCASRWYNIYYIIISILMGCLGEWNWLLCVSRGPCPETLFSKEHYQLWASRSAAQHRIHHHPLHPVWRSGGGHSRLHHIQRYLTSYGQITRFNDACRFCMQSNVVCDVLEEQPVGKVSNLRVVESLGSTVRLGWTGVAGATQYRIFILNREGKHLFWMYSSLPLLTSIHMNLLLIVLMKVCVFVCVSCHVSG